MFSRNLFSGVFLLCVFVFIPTIVHADVLFNENFEGYTSFPNQDPLFDPINAGISKISEGASEIWYGGRFEIPDNGTIDSDLAVQKFGGGTNNTHTGRVEDDAGLLFQHHLARQYEQYKSFLAHLQTVCTQKLYKKLRRENALINSNMSIDYKL